MRGRKNLELGNFISGLKLCSEHLEQGFCVWHGEIDGGGSDTGFCCSF